MNTSQRLPKFIFISLFFHIVVATLLFVVQSLTPTTNSNSAIEISLIENLTEPPINKAKLVVESDSQMANNKLTDKALYLSEKSNSVEKETRAKLGTKFLNAQNVAAQSKPQAQSKSKNKSNKNTPPQKIDLFNNNFDAYTALNKKQNLAENGGENTPQAQNNEASTTNDSLKNIENDLITRLNTREYKYFGYYSRIKNQLNQWWVPQVQQKFSKMMRQGRSIASEENKVTKLVIVLNDVGNLVKVQVLAESGVRDLDEAAVEAFRQAAPFPNPPKGMIEGDGTVKIRWDCVVES